MIDAQPLRALAEAPDGTLPEEPWPERATLARMAALAPAAAASSRRAVLLLGSAADHAEPLLAEAAAACPTEPGYGLDRGRLCLPLGRPEAAPAALGLALEAASPPDRRADRAAILRAIAAAHDAREDPDAALAAAAESVDLAREVLAGGPEDAARTDELASCLARLVGVHEGRGDLAAGHRALVEALGLRRHRAIERPADARARAALATTLGRPGWLRDLQEGPAAALGLARERLGLRRALAPLHPGGEADLALALEILADLLERQANGVEAGPPRAEALALRQSLGARFPDDVGCAPGPGAGAVRGRGTAPPRARWPGSRKALRSMTLWRAATPRLRSFWPMRGTGSCGSPKHIWPCGGSMQPGRQRRGPSGWPGTFAGASPKTQPQATCCRGCSGGSPRRWWRRTTVPGR